MKNAVISPSPVLRTQFDESLQILKEFRIRDCQIYNSKDGYVAPRSLLRPLVQKAFSLLSEAKIHVIVEYIIHMYMCCVMPEDMNEIWAKESVNNLLRRYQKQVMAGEDPIFEHKYEVQDFCLNLLTEEEELALDEEYNTRVFIDEEPDQQHVPQYWDKFEGRTPQEQLEFVRNILAEAKAKREAFVSDQVKV
jgi:hypothetical protein